MLLSENIPYMNSNLSDAERAEDLLSRMTLEEKVGQMCQFVGLEFLREVDDMEDRPADNDDTFAMYPGMSISEIEESVEAGLIGSFLYVKSAEEANALQTLAAKSQLGIPLLMGIDAIHGNALIKGATVYPTQIGLASTFDEELVETMARQTALEMRAMGSHWAFSPNIEITRDPRWGRVGETFGEDPLLTGRLGAAMVRGYENKRSDQSKRALSCIKHLIAGGVPVNGLNSAPVDMSERELRSVYLPPFLECLKENAGSLMTAHHDLNGVPCHSNSWIVADLMRSEGGFNGFVVSDWMDIERLSYLHQVAPDSKEAIYQSLIGGIDMHMHGPGYLEAVSELVKEGRIQISRIDQSAKLILMAKFRLGLFEEAIVDPKASQLVTFCQVQRDTALEAARKSIVLLKNEGGLLPLDVKEHSRILVTGPLADSHALMGDWTLEQPSENVVTVIEGLKQIASQEVEIVFADCGTQVRKTPAGRIENAVRLAQTVDIAVVVVGENGLRYQADDKTSGENVDRADIELVGQQLELVQSIAQTGKPVVVVLINGRPLGLEWIVSNVSGLVEAWEPGSQGGQAIAEVLFGQVNPSGRLPMSFPRHAGHIQTFYNHKPAQLFHPLVIGETGALFEFGYGLSYTNFEYKNLNTRERVAQDEDVEISVDISNTGDRAGDEVVLAFVSDKVASVTTPVRELKAFSRVALEPKETKTVSLTISYVQLALFDRNNCWRVEPGEFALFVGTLEATFEVVG